MPYIEKRLGGERGRSYIESMSEDDRRHGINSFGNMANDNAYGELVFIDESDDKEYPVICGHGGSMWLCRDCKNKIMEEQAKKDKKVIFKNEYKYGFAIAEYESTEEAIEGATEGAIRTAVKFVETDY